MASLPMDLSPPPPPPPQQVQVRFVTRHADIAVPAAPILVPANLRRYGLSQIINHLLDTAAPVPFDFLTGGAFLRTSLDSFLQQSGLSAESVVTLEYVRAVVPPKFQAAFQHDDWVSAVSTALAASGRGQARILSGSYDGIARVWNLSGQVLAEAPGHAAAIKAARWIDPGSTFATSSMDRGLRLWSYADDADDASAGTIAPTAELLGHRSTVENIAVHAASRRLLSASADATVGLWSTLAADSPPAPSDVLPPRPKKRKTALPTAPRHGPLALLSGHAAPVSAVTFDPRDATVAYSASWDHTIRTWDLPTQALVDTRTTQHPILAVCALEALSLLACGSSARHITLHDPRASASAVATSTLRGHTNAVSALCADPRSEWQLASSGHDGTVRVWDVRAAGSGSMFTIKREGGEGLSGREKVFDVEWSAVGIVSGGEDKRVQINETPRGGEETAVVAGKL